MRNAGLTAAQGLTATTVAVSTAVAKDVPEKKPVNPTERIEVTAKLAIYFTFMIRIEISDLVCGMNLWNYLNRII